MSDILFSHLADVEYLIQISAGGVMVTHVRTVESKDADGNEEIEEIADRKIFTDFETFADWLREELADVWGSAGDVERALRSATGKDG